MHLGLVLHPLNAHKHFNSGGITVFCIYGKPLAGGLTAKDKKWRRWYVQYCLAMILWIIRTEQLSCQAFDKLCNLGFHDEH